jgi:hypothetical protein
VSDGLYYQPEARVGLTERELEQWISRLRQGGRQAGLVPDELERAVTAAKEAGLVIEQPPARVA